MWWRLNSPAYGLFTQPFIRAQGLCAGNSPVTGEFPAQMASNAENVSIWWRHDIRTIWGPENSVSRMESQGDDGWSTKTILLSISYIRKWRILVY